MWCLGLYATTPYLRRQSCLLLHPCNSCLCFDEKSLDLRAVQAPACPSFTDLPWHNARDLYDAPTATTRLILAKREMVRKSGVLFGPNTLNAMPRSDGVHAA